MKVLLVNGSSRKNGSTFTALKEVEKTLLEEGIETEIYQIGREPISGCLGCRACAKLGRCVINDQVNPFIEKAAEFDGFIFGTPVFWAHANGSLISFLDRVFYAASSSGKEVFRMKPAASVIALRRAGATATYDNINKYFGISEMPIISSCYWNMIHGRTPEEAVKDVEGLRVMRQIGRNMAWFLKCKEAGKAVGIEMPKAEVASDWYRYN